MSPIEYNQEMQGYANTIKDSVKEEGVRLPFPHALIYWSNGDARNKKAADTTYFGGWAVSSNNMEDLIAQSGVGLHSAFFEADLVNNEGKEYKAYIARSITIAVCAKRMQWGDGITMPKGSHVQILALAAELDQDKKGFTAWAPVVLSAKGYSAKFINDALSQWDSASAAARREFAGGMPSQFFWAAIGTFGTEPIFESVGKTQKATITPCKCWLPKEFNDALISRHFVGADNVKRMAELAKLSEEWRKAWVGKGEKTEAPDNFAQGEESQPTVSDMDIPF
jgi:uncharacterized protein CbrC (UPF0167 family)